MSDIAIDQGLLDFILQASTGKILLLIIIILIFLSFGILYLKHSAKDNEDTIKSVKDLSESFSKVNDAFNEFTLVIELISQLREDKERGVERDAKYMACLDDLESRVDRLGLAIDRLDTSINNLRIEIAPLVRGGKVDDETRR